MARLVRAFLVALAIAAAVVPSRGAEPVEMEAAGPAGALRGTFLPASGDAGTPPVLVLPGSGAVDRDGNVALGIRAAPYRRLAQALADRGIPTLRFDKRGVGASAGDPNDVVMADYVADTRAWIAALRARTGAPCIWLVGHSEGGLVALLTAQAAVQAAGQAGADDLCGLVLLAAPGRPMGVLLREQLRLNPGYGNLVDEADGAIAALERGERVDPATLQPALAALFRPAVQRYLIDAFGYDPAAIAARTRLPLLTVHGTRDIQVPPVDAEHLAAARPDARRVSVPDMNHVLSAVPTDDLAANLAAYTDSDRPLAPGLVEAVARFVKSDADARIPNVLLTP